jgi:hypothetical protein
MCTARNSRSPIAALSHTHELNDVTSSIFDPLRIARDAPIGGAIQRGDSRGQDVWTDTMLRFRRALIAEVGAWSPHD